MRLNDKAPKLVRQLGAFNQKRKELAMADASLQNISPNNQDTFWNALSYPLTQGFYTIIDIDDLDVLTQRKWQITKGCNNRRYAAASITVGYKKRKFVRLHRILLNPADDLVCDHINGNSLDNRRVNLRICTHGQNQQNRAAINNIRKSRYKGVQWFARRSCWRVLISCEKKRIFVGEFLDEKSAALAFNEAAIKYHGAFAYLNKLED